MKSVTDLLGSASAEEAEAFLASLSDNALLALPFLFEHWAHRGHQLAPEGDWHTWVVLGGRGAGKTRTGAEWVRAQVEGATPEAPGKARRVALLGETYDQARDVMVMGDSGILACSPPDRRPDWQASKRRLVWPNGAEAQVFSARDPEALRGPQFDAAWADELAKWPNAEDAWDMLQFCLRLGDDPRAVVTTTPRSVPLLRQLLDEAGTVKTSAPTEANRLFLAESFLEKVTSKYGGTRLGRQELDGELLTDTEGAFWRMEMLDAARLKAAPPLDRIVVAIDPPAGSKASSDACGIVVVGVTTQGAPQDWRGYVIEDATISAASPTEWADRALQKMREYNADRLVAEVNMGGDMVTSVIRSRDAMVPISTKRAHVGKAARAEPVAALYEQGRVHHVGAHPALEDQMTQITRAGFTGQGSPDRLDALVWALHDLMIEPAAHFVAPRVRAL
ncbi:DNA-packaging protein [Oceanibium sediminis]|uniref:DNA-packaging protein n=1 Tax=Oceanibium sediminis TaxID=2026339 RepID=UPI003519E0E2